MKKVQPLRMLCLLVASLLAHEGATAAEQPSTQELTKQLLRCGVVGDALGKVEQKYSGSSRMFFGAAAMLTSPQKAAQTMMSGEIQQADGAPQADLVKEFEGCQSMLFANREKIEAAIAADRSGQSKP